MAEYAKRAAAKTPVCTYLLEAVSNQETGATYAFPVNDGDSQLVSTVDIVSGRLSPAPITMTWRSSDRCCDVPLSIFFGTARAARTLDPAETGQVSGSDGNTTFKGGSRSRTRRSVLYTHAVDTPGAISTPCLLGGGTTGPNGAQSGIRSKCFLPLFVALRVLVPSLLDPASAVVFALA